jgi:hypothetical protein
MLTDSLLILSLEFRIFVLDDLAEAHLRQFLRHQLLVEEASLNSGLS